MTIIQQSYDITGAKEIILEGWGDVSLSQGEEEVMVIETEDSLLPKLKTEVNAGRLELGFRSKLDYIFNILHPKVKYTLTVREVEKVAIAGSGKVIAATDLRAGDLKLKISGSGDMEFRAVSADGVEASIVGSGDMRVADLQAGRLSFHLPGSGKAVFSGRAPELEASISGSGKLDAQELQADTAVVKISGSGDARVNAVKTLETRISGSGKISYAGSPAVRSSISGSGKVAPAA